MAGTATPPGAFSYSMTKVPGGRALASLRPLFSIRWTIHQVQALAAEGTPGQNMTCFGLDSQKNAAPQGREASLGLASGLV